jgi:hypothetical protein
MEYLIHQINDYIAKFFEDTILPDNGVGIYTRLKFDTESGEEDPEQDTDKLLYRGDPFWTSSHGSNSDSANLEVNNPLKKIDPWHDFAYIEWRTSVTEGSDDVTVIPDE